MSLGGMQRRMARLGLFRMTSLTYFGALVEVPRGAQMGLLTGVSLCHHPTPSLRVIWLLTQWLRTPSESQSVSHSVVTPWTVAH